MQEFANWAQRLGRMLLGLDVRVSIYRKHALDFSAAYGRGGRLSINLARMGIAWTSWPVDPGYAIALLVHEYAHEHESNHLAEAYHDELCHLAAKLALMDPKEVRP
jgi:hypothetical protein